MSRLISLQRTATPVFAHRDPNFAEVTTAIYDISTAFQDFRANNDARLTALEREAREIDAEMKQLNERGALARTHGGNVDDFDSPAAREERDIFSRFARGDLRAGMTTDSKPDGGFLVPTTVESGIARLAGDAVSMRSVARIVSVSSDVYVRVTSQQGPTANWVGEKDARPQTQGMKLAEQEIPLHELQAMPAVNQRLLDDARIDVAAELSGEISTAFGELENLAFVAGDGIKKPRGFLSYDLVANASQSWGKLGFLKSGDAAGFIATSASTSPADVLIDLIYSLKAAYRNGAVWMMNSKTASIVRKWKDADGRFLWSDSIAPGQPAMLLGHPVVVEEAMPDVDAGTFPIAFGNFLRGYTILDRIGMRVLRDPFSSKPYVLFYTTKRVGGFVSDFNAIKLLKISA